MGCERSLFIVSSVFAALLIFVGMTKLTMVVGTVFWVATLFILRKMAKADPRMSQVYLKHVSQQDYYPARSRSHRR